MAGKRIRRFVECSKSSLTLSKESSDTVNAVVSHHRRYICKHDQANAVRMA